MAPILMKGARFRSLVPHICPTLADVGLLRSRSADNFVPAIQFAELIDLHFAFRKHGLVPHICPTLADVGLLRSRSADNFVPAIQFAELIDLHFAFRKHGDNLEGTAHRLDHCLERADIHICPGVPSWRWRLA